MTKQLSSRLAEIRDRLDLIGDDGDTETMDEAIKIVQTHEQRMAEEAQGTLPVDAAQEEPIAAPPGALPDPRQPDTGKARRDDRPTSKAAAAFPGRDTQRLRVLEAIAAEPNGSTAMEVAQITGDPYVSVSTRISELKDQGWVTEQGTRPNPEGGTRADVIVLTPAARSELSQRAAVSER